MCSGRFEIGASEVTAIAEHCTVSRSTIGNYTGDDREPNGCTIKDPKTGGYEITPLGEKALDVPWNEFDS